MRPCAKNRKHRPTGLIHRSTPSPTGWGTRCPRRLPQHILRWRDNAHAATIGLSGLSDEDWIAHFGRFEALEGNLPQPLALRYHGHQFRHYNPELGDGRGFLFAQMRDGAGRLMDLGTKGSGVTPWSRQGDGRLTLKGAMREILATTMLEALGANTSKTFSVIETGEHLHRGDEPSPTRSAVLVRLSHGHIRIGSFQRLMALEEDAHLAALVDYALAQYPAPGARGRPDAGNPAVILLHQAVERLADMAASYVASGFVHGVLNTDNMNITGESFDYGPWRWLPAWDAGFTAAYFDHSGLYAFGRQSEAIAGTAVSWLWRCVLWRKPRLWWRLWKGSSRSSSAASPSACCGALACRRLRRRKMPPR
jgi:uncharacterized protein YdiU (UPF0061 family)